jgi:hypothetical protein
MTIRSRLDEARKIWGSRSMTAEEIAIATGVVTGDIQRYVRDINEHRAVDEATLKKELGNMIFSGIRWCGDLGYEPEECIRLAKEAQEAYRKRT